MLFAARARARAGNIIYRDGCTRDSGQRSTETRRDDQTDRERLTDSVSECERDGDERYRSMSSREKAQRLSRRYYSVTATGGTAPKATGRGTRRTQNRSEVYVRNGIVPVTRILALGLYFPKILTRTFFL